MNDTLKIDNNTKFKISYRNNIKIVHMVEKYI